MIPALTKSSTPQDDIDFDSIIGEKGLNFTMTKKMTFDLYKKKYELFAAVGIFKMKLLSYSLIKNVGKEKTYHLEIEPCNDGTMYVSMILFKSLEEASEYLKDNFEQLLNASEL